jgi:hypothetical protein
VLLQLASPGLQRSDVVPLERERHQVRRGRHPLAVSDYVLLASADGLAR